MGVPPTFESAEQLSGALDYRGFCHECLSANQKPASSSLTGGEAEAGFGVGAGKLVFFVGGSLEQRRYCRERESIGSLRLDISWK